MTELRAWCAELVLGLVEVLVDLAVWLAPGEDDELEEAELCPRCGYELED